MAVGNTKWNDRELVITDTGTSFILGPDAKIASIAREVGAKFDDDFQLV